MEFKLPELGEGLYEAELIRWLVKPGDSVRRSQGLMEVMTDKATMEVPSPFVGSIESLEAKEGSQIKVGEVILKYAVGEPKAPGVEEKVADESKKVEEKGRRRDGEKNHSGKSAATETPVVKNRRVEAAVMPKAAPSVRLMARKLGIDLAHLHGSGPDGRILIEDVTSQVKIPDLDGNSKADNTSLALPAMDYGKPGTRQKLQGLRRIMAEHMVRAKQIIPHAAYIDECDVTELVRLRDSLRDAFAKDGIKLTYVPFFAKAVAAALKEIPIVNSSFNDEAGEIVLHDHYHIGVATATQAGLIVPVLHDADRADLVQVARELNRLSEEAKAGKSKLEDLRGGTFTITSIGGYGGLISTPVVNHPQTAILGLGRIVKRPVYDSVGNLKPADMLYLSLSFDHRVLDGANAAAFCNSVIKKLQTPAVLLLPDHQWHG
jgi:pyruvate dehydrogenase E2 component (dihydrolipoamide acetyltransferase)/2-oxoisovalerate dehydrogenase E2 component (dihydrolipoyl transacylase)